MSENPYTNMDARDLWDLAQEVAEAQSLNSGIMIDSEGLAMLLRAAQHLQSMDEKLAKSIEGTFAQGAAFAERAARARSNVLPSPGRRITNEEGETLIASFTARGGEVKKILAGTTTPKAPEIIKVDPSKSVPARTGFRLKDL